MLAQQGARIAIICFGDAETPSHVEGVQIIKRAAYSGNGRLVGKVREALRLWQALRRAPSAVVVHKCAGAELGVIGVFTRATRRRLVFSAENVIDFDFARLARTRLEYLLYRAGILLTNQIVVQTEEQVALCERAFRRTPVVIKSLAEPSQRTEHRAEAFLWVGRLVWYKRPQDYLTLAKALPEAKFWMVGVPTAYPDDERAFGEQILEDARAIANLELLSPRPQREIGQLMARAVASVNTADFEGMPNVLLEAWCRGVPGLVLTYDPGGVVTRCGLGGFADGSMQRLIDLARELWYSRGDRTDLAQRCQEYVSRNHAPGVVTTQWQDVLATPHPVHTTTDLRTRR